jgi:DNA-directed RNA polymerase specialized sigma24 family protein
VWQRSLQKLTPYLHKVGLRGVHANVKSRRFDTEAVLEKIIKHDKEGFASFYERYRGRVYRFIVRQYGTSEYGKAAYYSTWRHLVVAGLTSKTPKDLKLSFFRYLGTSVGSLMTSQRSHEQTNYLPKDIESDGNWSLSLIEHLKQLDDINKRYFLFKHEIGISEAAIAKTFGVKRKVVENTIKETEIELMEALEGVGLTKRVSLEKLYRESRVVKSPFSWDKEILDSFDMWVKQADKPQTVHQSPDGHQEAAGLSGKWTHFKDQVKSKLSTMNKKVTTKHSRNRKFSSSHN